MVSMGPWAAESLPDEDAVWRGLQSHAFLYELRHGQFQADWGLYRFLASEASGPVLEAGCGTGRLLPLLAEVAPLVVGVDKDASMLESARQRVAGAGPGRVLLLQADLQALPVQDMALIVMALNTLAELPSPAQQAAALQAASRALRRGGLLVLDVPNAPVEASARPDAALILEHTYDLGNGLLQEWSVTHWRSHSQQLEVTLVYDYIGPSAVVRRKCITKLLRLPYRSELELMLKEAGLHSTQVFGAYDMQPWCDESPRLLMLAQKPTGKRRKLD